MARPFLIAALLVVGAFVVYDLWRGPGSHVAPRPEREPDPTAGADVRTDRRLDALARRVEALEARLAAAEAAEAAPEEAPAAPAAPAPPPDVPPLPASVDDEFTSDEVARFLALERAALRHRRARAVAAGLARKLDRMTEPPAGDERARVLEESLRIWAAAERVRANGAVTLDPAARRDAVADLARDLEDTLTSLVPDARGKAIAAIVRAHLGLGSGAALDAGAGAQAAADEPPR